MTERPEGGLSGAELQRRAITGSVWTAVHTIVSVPVAFVANAVVARVLGPSDYGELAFLTLVLSLLVILANAGFSDGVVQWGAGAEAKGDRRHADELLRKSLGFQVLFQMPLLVGAVVILARDEPLWVNAALVVSVTLPAIFSSAVLALTIENRTAAGARLAMAGNVVLQASLVVAAVSTHSAAAVWTTRSVAASVLWPVSLFLLSEARRRVVLRPSYPSALPSGFWRFALLTWIAGILGTLVFNRSEIFLLRALSDPVALGQFALAFGVATQIKAPVDALLGPLVPAVSGLLSAAAETATRALDRALRFASLLGGAILGAVLPPLYFLMPVIYGSSFEPAADLLLPLAAITCLQASLNPIMAFLLARRQSGLMLRVYLLALAADVIVAVATIPPLGAWGAVLANAAAQIVAFALLASAEARAHGRTTWWVFRRTKALAAGTAAGAIAVALPALVASTWLAAAASLALGLPLYLAATRVLSAGLRESDWAALGDALPRFQPLVGRISRLATIPD